MSKKSRYSGLSEGSELTPKQYLKDACLHRQVFELAKTGISISKILEAIGFKTPLTQKPFRNSEEFKKIIKQGRAIGCAEVAKALLKSATVDRNVKAQIFYLQKQDKLKWGEEDTLQPAAINIHISDIEKDL